MISFALVLFFNSSFLVQPLIVKFDIDLSILLCAADSVCSWRFIGADVSAHAIDGNMTTFLIFLFGHAGLFLYLRNLLK